MIKEINKDQFLLSQPSLTATKEDLSIAADLKDTLQAHKETCIGMAANMIGYLKNIIAIQMEKEPLVMINPEIIQTSKTTYTTEEGCLSLTGQRKTKRYESVKVKYQDEQFKIKIKTFHGLMAQAIQHEIDHCKGILI